MSRVSAAIALLALVTLCGQLRAAGTTSSSAQRGEIGKWLPKVEAWIAAAHAHQAGKADDAAKRVGKWPNGDLELIAPYVEALAKMIAAGESADLGESAPLVRSPIEREQVQRLAREEIARGRRTLARSGAVLHADVMMLGIAPEVYPLSAAEARREQQAGRQVLVMALDGHHDGFATVPRHWTIARRLMSAIPASERDQTVLLWYHATSAYMMMRNRWGEVREHLVDAGALFPDNAQIEMDLGCVFEVRASPRIQTVLAAARTFRSDIGSAETNLRVAEKHFQRAIALDPKMTEAHVRLARVRTLLGDAERAARDLEPVVSASSDPIVRYYARLLLGDAHQAAGRRDAALEAYQSAARLYPGAQAPHLAVSAMAREAGDRTGAQFALQHFLRLSPKAEIRYDPWWAYSAGSGRRAGTLVRTLWAAMGEAAAP